MSLNSPVLNENISNYNPRKYKARKWTNEDAAAHTPERSVVDDLFEHLLPWFSKTADGENLVVFATGDYRWIRILRDNTRPSRRKPKRQVAGDQPIKYCWSSPFNKTPRRAQQREAYGSYEDLVRNKIVVASIWTCISGDGLRFFCDYLVKHKPAMVKKFLSAKGLNALTQLIVDNYKTLTRQYVATSGLQSKKERTLRGY